MVKIPRLTRPRRQIRAALAADTLEAGASSGIRLNPADRFFEGQSLAGDFGLTERRRDRTQLSNEGAASPFVQGAPRFPGILFKAGNGLGNQRIIVSHCTQLMSRTALLSSTVLF